MYVTSFGMVLSVLEDLGSAALVEGDVKSAMEYATAAAILQPLAKRANDIYTGLPIEGDIIHDLYHTLGLFCPDMPDAGEDTSYRNGDRNTSGMQA
jgi:hypothetical protein